MEIFDSGFEIGLNDRNGKPLKLGDKVLITWANSTQKAEIAFGHHFVVADDPYCSGYSYGFYLKPELTGEEADGVKGYCKELSMFDADSPGVMLNIKIL